MGWEERRRYSSGKDATPLASESLTRENRNWATELIATVQSKKGGKQKNW